MNKKNLFMILLSLATSWSAQASFNTDAGHARVVCTGANLKLSINANRSRISVLTPGDDGHPAIYKVVARDSDGDSYVLYKASSPQSATINLVFADEGAMFGQMADAIQFAPMQPPVSLSCSKK